MRHMITITNRFTPFTHTPGLPMLLPGTLYTLEAFPTLCRIFREGEEHRIVLHLTGPVEGFTALQNQEKNRIEIFGRAQEGFFLFYLVQVESEIRLTLRRGKELSGMLQDHPFILRRGENLSLPVQQKGDSKETKERLSFGIHKQLHWESIERRFDMKELLPLLFFLGQKYPAAQSLYLQSEEEFRKAVKSYFGGLLVPQESDQKFLGLSLDRAPKEQILASFFSALRTLFFQEKAERLSILPHLWPSLPAGRLLALHSSWGEIDIEWTKKKLRRLQLSARKTGELLFEWPKEIASYRLKRHIKERGIVLKRNALVSIEAGQRYLLDRFEK